MIAIFAGFIYGLCVCIYFLLEDKLDMERIELGEKWSEDYYKRNREIELWLKAQRD